jgi:hypothetical protein
MSAENRPRDQAERLAKAERDKRDPVRTELARIANREAQEARLQKAKNITVEMATDRWVRSEKIEGKATLRIYLSATWRIESLAADEKIVNVRAIAEKVLDKWRNPDTDFVGRGPFSQRRRSIRNRKADCLRQLDSRSFRAIDDDDLLDKLAGECRAERK